MKRNRLAPLVAIAALAVGLLTGCAGGGGDASGSSSSLSDSASKDGAGGTAEASRAGGTEAFAPDQEALPETNGTQQQVITTSDLTLQSDHPEEAAEEISQVAQRLGGSVESLSTYQASGDAPAGASLTVRVPSDQLDAAIDQFAKIGEVVSQTRSAQDVTTEYVDLEARIKALETSVKRLTDLMAGAATTSELIEAEGALTQRQQELDGLRAQLKALEGQVSEATIWATITASSVLPGGGPGSFWEGLIAGLHSIAAAGAGALVVLGIALPWLVVAAVIAATTVAIIRARRSRRARAARPGDQTPAQL